jgi:hypothetical protein
MITAIRTPASPPALSMAAAAGSAPQRSEQVDAFRGPSAARPPDGLLSYEELSDGQRSLLSRREYEELDLKGKGVFLLHTRRLERNGVELTGLRLQGGAAGIHATNTRFELVFEPDPAAMARLKADVAAGVEAGRFFEEKPFAPFHPGYSDSGVRENRSKYTLQIGFGPAGAFVDMDHYNPRSSLWNHVLHWGEILTPGTMDPLAVARDLGEDIWTHQA